MVKGYRVSPTSKPRSINFTLPKDKGIKFGYMGVIERLAKQRLSPSAYKVSDPDGFSPKHIRGASLPKS